MIKHEAKFLGDYIQGQFLRTERPDGQFKDISPADLNDVVMNIEYSWEHVDRAVESARKAYLPWARLSQDERRNYLLRLKEMFDTHAEKMAEAISRDTGKPLWEGLTEAKALSNKIDITLNFSSKLVAQENIPNALPGVKGVIRHKSRGVMAVVGPFNFPAHLPNGHISPAL